MIKKVIILTTLLGKRNLKAIDLFQCVKSVAGTVDNELRMRLKKLTKTSTRKPEISIMPTKSIYLKLHGMTHIYYARFTAWHDSYILRSFYCMA